MGFNWIPFTDTETSFAARVTIRQTGQFGFTSGAVNRFKLNDYMYAVLYFDESQRAVGIELTNFKKPGAIEIKKSSSNTYLRSKNFCDKYGIDYSKASRYCLREDGRNTFLYFLLADAEDGADDADNATDEEAPTTDTVAKPLTNDEATKFDDV